MRRQLLCSETNLTVSLRSGNKRNASTATLMGICKEYHQKITKLESEKYDIEYVVRQKDYEVSKSTTSFSSFQCCIHN